MANPRRIKRLEKVIQQAAANHAQRELQDPRIGLISITRVKLTPDLSQAILFWSVIGEEAQRRTTERGLQDALPSIQRAIAKSMQTRVTPRCELRYDEGMEHAQRLESIFTKLREERGDIEPVGSPPEGDDPALDDGSDETDAGEAGGGKPDSEAETQS
ncbi:MAG: 30S ribosome-binding factor RbfA [Planctomycetota bacterium]|nr:30S ribosome-binding factor RbfA [Planctomycetota bacterium]